MAAAGPLIPFSINEVFMKSLLIGLAFCAALLIAAITLFPNTSKADTLPSGPPTCSANVCVLNSAGGYLADWLPWYFENGHKKFVIPVGAVCNSMCSAMAVWKVTHDADKGLANWSYKGQLCWCHPGLRDEFVMAPLESHGYGNLVRKMLTGEPFKVPK